MTKITLCLILVVVVLIVTGITLLNSGLIFDSYISFMKILAMGFYLNGEVVIDVRQLLDKFDMMKPPPHFSLIEPKIVSDMKKWNFTYKRKCPIFQTNKPSMRRYKYNLNCQRKIPIAFTSVTNNPFDIFDISFGSACLSIYIENVCKDEHLVPNVVHYVWFGNRQLGFFNFLSLMSVLRFMKPCVILIHGPDTPYGPYWQYFLNMSPNIIHVHRNVPRKIFGHTLRYKQHSSDVMRIEALIEYGGVYLDFDEVLLRPIHLLRRFNYTQGRETPRMMGSQAILAEKNATFLQLWYKSYRSDYRSTWAHNALKVPNDIAKTRPDLINVEGFKFIKSSIRYIFYENYVWGYYYGLHMFERFYKKPINPNIIRTLNTTVGSVSRHILFGNKELCIT